MKDYQRNSVLSPCILWTYVLLGKLLSESVSEMKSILHSYINDTIQLIVQLLYWLHVPRIA